MPVQVLMSFDPHQFLNLHRQSDAGFYRLDTGVGGVAVFNTCPRVGRQRRLWRSRSCPTVPRRPPRHRIRPMELSSIF